MDYIPTHIRFAWNPANDIRFTELTSSAFEAFGGAALGLARLAKRMHNSGVNIMAGSDSANPVVVPGYRLQKELELLVNAGFLLNNLSIDQANNSKVSRRRAIGQLGLTSVAIQFPLAVLVDNPWQTL